MPPSYCRTPNDTIWTGCWVRLRDIVGKDNVLAAKGLYNELLIIAKDRYEKKNAVNPTQRGWIVGCDDRVLGVKGIANYLVIEAEQVRKLLLAMIDAGLIERRDCPFAKDGDDVCELWRAGEENSDNVDKNGVDDSENGVLGNVAENRENSDSYISEVEQNKNDKVNINKDLSRIVNSCELSGSDGGGGNINKDAGCAGVKDNNSQGLVSIGPELSRDSDSQGSQEKSRIDSLSDSPSSHTRSRADGNQGAKGPSSGQADNISTVRGGLGDTLWNVESDDPIVILDGLSGNQVTDYVYVIDRAEKWVFGLFPETVSVSEGGDGLYVTDEMRLQALGDLGSLRNAIDWCWRKDDSGRLVVKLIRETQAFCHRKKDKRNIMEKPMGVLMSIYKNELGWPGKKAVGSG
jgi:hypothetical protein